VSTGRIVVDPVNRCSYAFPVALVEDLQGTSDDALAGVQVEGLGFNLHFPALDADLYVPALVSGIFGTRAWMAREPARVAGRKTSTANTLAARANGAKEGARGRWHAADPSDLWVQGVGFGLMPGSAVPCPCGGRLGRSSGESRFGLPECRPYAIRRGQMRRNDPCHS
jgi:hypothetical protein